jgi:hypothetical protein
MVYTKNAATLQRAAFLVYTIFVTIYFMAMLIIRDEKCKQICKRSWKSSSA